MAWELVKPTAVDYHVLLELRDTSGRAIDDQEESLGGGGDGPSTWQPGRWLIQNSFVLVGSAPPGDYTVTAALYDSKARRTVPTDLPGAAHEVPIGRLTVR
jgi:hypothetical protein